MSRLEEVKQSIKEIMETPYGIRSIKAKEVGIDLVVTGKIDSLLQEIYMLKEQNQRYKQALEEVLKKSDDILLRKTVRQALKGESQ